MRLLDRRDPRSDEKRLRRHILARHERGETYRSIALDLGIDERHVDYFVQKARRERDGSAKPRAVKLTKRNEIVLHLAAHGRAPKDIANETGIPLDDVCQIVRDQGLGHLVDPPQPQYWADDDPDPDCGDCVEGGAPPAPLPSLGEALPPHQNDQGQTTWGETQ
jgi:hypothetical protein